MAAAADMAIVARVVSVPDHDRTRRVMAIVRTNSGFRIVHLSMSTYSAGNGL